MARKQSAGTLLYRHQPDGLYVLLVHPSGPYNRGAPWSIPKGAPDEDESLEAAARRETLEETGVEAGELIYLGWIDYRRSRKRVHAYAGPAPPGCAPRCASWEVDCAELVPMARAWEVLHPDQRPFLERLKERLTKRNDSCK